MITVVGLNHKSAPINVREKLAFNGEDTLDALGRLTRRYPDMEFVLLSTCNRVELYSSSFPSAGPDIRSVVGFLADYHQVAASEFEPLAYRHKEEHAVRHLLTVISSLDSMVVGEGQIIGQVKESYRLACAAGSTGKILNRLFHCAFATAKKVHTQTGIASGRVSIAGVAVELANQLFAQISGARVVILGAGQMGELLAQHLLHVGCKNITVVNRSYDHGRDLAERYGIQAGLWEDLPRLIGQAQIVIASASAGDYLVTRQDLQAIIGKRRVGSLLIIDISVPRTFEPSIHDMEGVYLYSVDELSTVAEENRKTREKDIIKALQIVNGEVSDFMGWLVTKDIGPLVGEMRKKFAEISKVELEHFFVGSRREASCRHVMEPMVKRLVNRLLHCVIKNVDQVAKEHGPAHAARLLSGIVEEAGEHLADSSSCEEKK
jgi:glutamyl-tRNA reductase